MSHDAFNGRPRCIVKEYHSTWTQEPVHVVELNEGLIESMKAVYERQVDTTVRCHQLGQEDLRSLLVEFDKMGKASAMNVPEADAAPFPILKRVQNNVDTRMR